MKGEPILRTSERADFLRCQQAWWWRWREGLVTTGRVADALWFGTGIHIALAKWYVGPGKKRGPEPAETWAEWAVEEMRGLKIDRLLDDESEATYIDAKALGITMLEGYRALYGRDEHKLIIQAEKTFRLRVPWPADQKLYPDWNPHPWQPTSADALQKPGWPDNFRDLFCRVCGAGKEQPIHSPLFWYCGTYDATWRHAETGQIWLDEHKTAKTISIAHLDLDPQAGSYWAMAGRTLRDEGLIGPRERLAGIEYNFLRKGVPDERPKDAQGYYTNKPTKANYIAALTQYYHGIPPAKNLKLEDLEAAATKVGLTVLGDRSKQQSAPLFQRVPVHRTSKERNSQLVRLQSEGLQMAAIKDGILPIVKNPTRDCGFCVFHDMCALHEAGGNWQDFKRAGFRREDPYADHR
jgi:hypothetical protein